MNESDPRPGSARPANLSPTRFPSTPRDRALWAGFVQFVSQNGHAYGGGFWGGN
jgi:hypothetical protein